jgi:hypothetical protein
MLRKKEESFNSHKIHVKIGEEFFAGKMQGALVCTNIVEQPMLCQVNW